jgi:hypothetical protein
MKTPEKSRYTIVFEPYVGLEVYYRGKIMPELVFKYAIRERGTDRLLYRTKSYNNGKRILDNLNSGRVTT